MCCRLAGRDLGEPKGSPRLYRSGLRKITGSGVKGIALSLGFSTMPRWENLTRQFSFWASSVGALFGI